MIHKTVEMILQNGYCDKCYAGQYQNGEAYVIFPKEPTVQYSVRDGLAVLGHFTGKFRQVQNKYGGTSNLPEFDAISYMWGDVQYCQPQYKDVCAQWADGSLFAGPEELKRLGEKKAAKRSLDILRIPRSDSPQP